LAITLTIHPHKSTKNLLCPASPGTTRKPKIGFDWLCFFAAGKHDFSSYPYVQQIFTFIPTLSKLALFFQIVLFKHAVRAVIPHISDFRPKASTCLAGLWHSRPSPSLNPAGRWSKLEAATRFPSILLGGSLITIVVYRDGDGFPPAKHVKRPAIGFELALFSRRPKSKKSS